MTNSWVRPAEGARLNYKRPFRSHDGARDRKSEDSVRICQRRLCNLSSSSRCTYPRHAASSACSAASSYLRRFITFDNDTAFAQHRLLRTMRDMTTWFCDAFASWQKGGVENANGRLRRWLPRHLDIDRTSDREIQEIVLTTNLTPRKCLGFKMPFQALLAELGKDVQIRFS